MVSSVLAGVLESYLGQYLELSDTSISVGSEIRLKNVQLKESALSDLGLPVTCVHGKVKRLVIKIPWFQLFTKKTTIEVEGLHLLVVPSTSVKYDEKKERREQNEAKQQRLQRIEDAKKMQLTEEDKGGGADQNNSSFAERLAANIIKNLEVTITKVHIRYEDKQPNTGRYPFAAGVTLDRLAMSTSHDDDEGSENDADVKLKVFGKHVVLESFAVYWRPKATLFSEDSKAKDEVIDLMFESNIGTRQKPVSKLKYLLGPISSDATMKWCPNPALFDFTIPQIDLGITMDELCLSLTKYQYQDFVMLLQSFEFLHRAAKFRKYKARHNLENVPNYVGRLRDLWKFAFDCVYEEEIMRRINNWSWEHMKSHLNRCKQYRRLYLQLLSTAKPSPELKKDLRRFEDALDEVNIRIQRQLAEREVEKKELELKRKKQEAAKGGFWGWWAGSSSGAASEDGEDGATPHGGKAAIKILENALSSEEKAKLYEVIDFQENAHHGIYPKRFLAKKLSFKLDNLLITIRDDDLSDSVVIRLDLESVSCHISQRPSADYLALKMTMNKLTVEGMRASKKDAVPMIVETKPQEGESGGRHLLNFSFENNPPENPNGDLDSDKGSLYDQRIRFFSSPLEVVFDSKTFNRLAGIFRTPDELNLSNLQHTAASKLRQYKEATTLGLQYAIDNHNLVDIDVKLMSSNIVIPHQGKLTGNCACVVANLGSIHVKSKPISVETKSLKELSLSDLSESFKNSLRDQAYDNFSVSLENMQLIVALAGEDWRSHVSKVKSPLFILNPTSLRVVFQYCLIKNDPDMPLAKVKGSLESIFINISDYRFIKLAQVIDSLLDAVRAFKRF